MGARHEKQLSTFYRLALQPHLPVGTVLVRNIRTFLMFGLEDPMEQRLGEGSFGAAYEVPVGGRTVIKVTRDPTEARAASILLGKPTERIVRIHGLWAVPETGENGLRPWYVIHRDYLEALNDRDTSLLDVVADMYDDQELDLTLPRPGQQRVMDQWRTCIREAIDNEDGIARRDVERSIVLLGQVGEAVAEMRRYGINWEDIHPDNLMRSATGRLCIGDIGWGEMLHQMAPVSPFEPEVVRSHLDRIRSMAARFASQPVEA